MIQAILMMGGLGVLVGAGLAVASKVFYVWVDPRVEAVEGALPGANCGGCGLPGCSANAEAIVRGKASPGSCVAAGPDVAQAIASVLGVAVLAKEPDIARPGCYFGVDDADLKFIYDGISDCRGAVLLNGGMKVCSVGCLGLGSCARACPFGAIAMGPEGLPVVDDAKCTGCGTCERVCPKHIITLSSVTRRILREYTIDECTTPCQRRCPAGIDIREYIRQIALGDYHRSAQVIKERNPFPTVIGRICPRPCEEDCRRGLTDEPVAINYLKRFAADFERESGKRVQPYRAPETFRKIAVVGGGVQGLSAAFFSARLGHSPTVIEATDKLGGLLRSAIARERLPMDILDYDIKGILEMGVTARAGMTLGEDFGIDTLLGEGYEAVFLATGGWDSRLTRVSGHDVEEPVSGVMLLVDLIKSDTGRSNKIPVKNEVVIAGGGISALRAARICADLGCRKVTALFRETPDALFKDTAELDELREEEAIEFVFGAAVSTLYGEGRQLTGVEYVDLFSGEKTRVAAENLFIAAGRFPELIFAPDAIAPDAIAPEDLPREQPREQPSSESIAKSVAAEDPIRWKAVAPYKKPECADEPGMMAPGDPLTDFKAAIRAIGAGRRAAASIHELMYGLSLDLPENVIAPNRVLQNVDHVEQVAEARRQIMPMAGQREMRRGAEREKGFSEEMAQKEAARCLQCGLICYERAEAPAAATLSDHTLDETAATGADTAQKASAA